MTSDASVHILNLIEMLLFCEQYKKYRNFTQSHVVEILRKWTVSADPWMIYPKVCGNYPMTENLHTRKSE